MSYPPYPGSPTELEEAVLARWREESLFRRVQEATRDLPPFVFFEGPPTANGRPGIHHVLSRTLKDLGCRFHTMRGHHITRKAGWDTHGLPVEIEAERKLGISGKRQIEELGVAKFNQVCRDSVFTYKEDWERLSERIGYWLDYSDPYITFTPEYIESLWNILATLHENRLLYRGYKSVPYCPRCGTALSSHEVAQGYEDVSDPSIYFLCPWLDDSEGRAFLVWTTTPWTLPSNVALALNPGLTYVEAEHEGRRLVLAEARAAAVLGEDVRIVRRYAARELEGVRYERPFDLVAAPASDTAWRVVLEDFVTAEDGTGIVHLAPAFGADDYAAGQRHDLPMLRPVDDAGHFTADVPLVGGQFVKDADEALVEDLKQRGLVFRYTHEVHTYPHCWRCSSPLLYMARDSWFLRTTAVRDTMLAHNARIGWHPPEMGSGRFGEWLAGNIDWAISRERYWGTPLPVWVCSENGDHIEVIGSYAQLAERAGALPPDFDPHKPGIDAFTWTCHCGGTMRRTPEVIDAWFDSGSMPYAQWHWPFENDEAFRRHFPADFICEGVDQTRGWFYSLMAIAAMLGMGPAYRNVLVNDLVLDAEGLKMSKSRGNVVDPWDAIGRFGADGIRWYFLTASQPWVPKRFDPVAVGEAARRLFDTLGNTYVFYALYAGLEGFAPRNGDGVESSHVLDRWLLSRLGGLARAVHADLLDYEVTRAARTIGDFVVDDLSNWYVRRSRDRFWGSGDAADTRAAFATLQRALTIVARLLAPLVPFHSDWLHRALTDGASVHLERYPGSQDGDVPDADEALEREMAAVRELARLGRAARDEVKIRVRQPLRTLHAVVPRGLYVRPELLDVLKAELNVKQVEFALGAESFVALTAQPNFRALGKRFGKRTPDVAERVRALPADALARFMSGGELAIDLDGEHIVLGADEVEVRQSSRGELVVQSDGGYTVALDPVLDDELRLEGLARELVNRIQRLRRDAGLAVSDRIDLAIDASGALEEAARRHADAIAREVLAVSFEVDGAGRDGWEEIEVEGTRARVSLLRAESRSGA